jgi:hypothetical protein
MMGSKRTFANSAVPEAASKENGNRKSDRMKSRSSVTESQRYTHPQKRAEESKEKGKRSQIREQPPSEDEESSEDEVPVSNKPTKPSQGRPYVLVPPIDRSIYPKNTAVAVSDVAGPPKHVGPETDAGKLPRASHVKTGRVKENLEKTMSEGRRREIEVVDEILEQTINLSLRKQLAVSPGVRKMVMQALKNMNVRRTPTATYLSEMAYKVDETIYRDNEKVLAETNQVVDIKDLPEVDTFEVLLQAEGDLEAGAVVHRDATVVFHQDVAPGDRDKVIIVANTSEALRSVYPVINKKEEVECILDPGSQIVAMDSRIAVGVGVNWDPDTTILMQSANGQLKKTLGLARNVPFAFGNLTVYLQLHIIEKAPYTILLGRPFDTLTESEVRNEADGYQELVLKCPNTGERITVGTHPRGQGKQIRIPGPLKLREEGTPTQAESSEGKAETLSASKGDSHFR